MRKKVFLITSLCLGFYVLIFSQESSSFDSNTFGEIKARHIGPATMSGRISALDAVENDPDVLYIGSASGGLWKSTNGGVKVKAVFDDYTQSIGAVCIDQKNPETVYVGTGESWVRNSVSVGDGIYKTTDGGKSWKHLGLEKTERISKIIIHPLNPDIIFVAALGQLWSSNPERGIYKSTDGGKSWEKVLFVDENTGASDISINPENPDILYAGMWDFRRKPYTFRSGGPGSGLYKTSDGGSNWTKLTENLPGSDLGRISVAVSPLKPDMVYTLIEAEGMAGGLYRSDNEGENWTLMNRTEAMTERPFYFSQLYPDHLDTMKLYKPSYNLNVSDDGGKTFRIAYVGGGNVHVDHHAFWVGKKNNHIMYLGTDGGVYRSNDQGKTWTLLRNLPVSQFYHVSVDNQYPYKVYGGLQDNGSWMAPNKSPGGIEIGDWENIGSGDGFYVFADKNDPNIIYWQSQGGNFIRFYKKTREYKEIRPYSNFETGKLRWNWNAPIYFSPNTDAIYVGAQYLFKSTDHGDSWKIISPDLTTNDPERLRQSESGGITIDNSTAENNCTIYTIGESPLDPNIIWVGTDDGKLHLSKDGGNSWIEVSQNIPGISQGNWISSVEPDKFHENTVYVTLDNHRNGDMRPYIFMSTNFGKSFRSITDENIEGYCFDIAQDPVNPDLLFAGTEFGLYISVNTGHSWSRLKGNIPKVAIHEIVIHPREHDLVLASHGRGILIVDDLTPLRALEEKQLNEELVFLPSRPYKIGPVSNKQSFQGDDEFIGSNPSDAVYITYYLKNRHIFGDMYIEIYNPEGEKVTTLPAGKRKGINRETWIPRKKPPKIPVSNTLNQGTMLGPNYPPGEYMIKIIKGEDIYEGSVNIVFDDQLPHSFEERMLQLTVLQKTYDLLEELAFLDSRIKEIQNALYELKKSDIDNSLKEEIQKLDKQLEEIQLSLAATKTGGITGEEQLREKISGIYSAVNSYLGKPTESQINRLEVLQTEFKVKQENAENFFKYDLQEINKKLIDLNLPKIDLLSREEFEKR